MQDYAVVDTVFEESLGYIIVWKSRSLRSMYW